MPFGGIAGAVVVSICSKHFTSVAIKITSSLICAGTIIALGYIINDDMVYIEI